MRTKASIYLFLGIVIILFSNTIYAQCTGNSLPADATKPLHLEIVCVGPGTPCDPPSPDCPQTNCIQMRLINDMCVPRYDYQGNVTWDRPLIKKVSIVCYHSEATMWPCKGAAYYSGLSPSDRGPNLLGHWTWNTNPPSGTPCNGVRTILEYRPEPTPPSDPPPIYTYTQGNYRPEDYDNNYIGLDDELLLRWCGCCKFSVHIDYVLCPEIYPCGGQPIQPYTIWQHVNACNTNCENSSQMPHTMD